MEDALTEAMTSFTAESAATTLRGALTGTDLADADLVVLRPPAENAVIAIPVAGLVARIGVSIRHRDRLKRELELASWLAGRGILAVGPATSLPTPQLSVAHGRVISWWQYLPTTSRGSAADVGWLLAQVHRQARPWPDLPSLDPWNRVQYQLAAATSVLPAEDLALLQEHWQWLRQRWSESRWPTAPQVVLHGDVHQGNTLIYQEQVFLLDFEDSCVGPRQWDVAFVIGSWQLGWLTDREFAEFNDAYGLDLRSEEDIDLLVDISLFRRTCWYASRAGREPQILDAVRHRIATLIDPSLPKNWRRG